MLSTSHNRSSHRTLDRGPFPTRRARNAAAGPRISHATPRTLPDAFSGHAFDASLSVQTQQCARAEGPDRDLPSTEDFCPTEELPATGELFDAPASAGSPTSFDAGVLDGSTSDESALSQKSWRGDSWDDPVALRDAALGKDDPPRDALAAGLGGGGTWPTDIGPDTPLLSESSVVPDDAKTYHPGRPPAVAWWASPRAAAGLVTLGVVLMAIAGWRILAGNADPVPPRGVIATNATDNGQQAASSTSDASAAVSSTPLPVVTPAAATSTPSMILVHVAGHVKTPGLVRLPDGSRVNDALAAAGKAVPGANLDALNLAATVSDGAQIYVPGPGDEGDADTHAAVGATSLASSNGGPTADAGSVNVNTASAADLERIPGVGPVLAGRIIAYRETNGPLRSPSDLQHVAGVGPKKLAGLLEHVSV